MRRIERDITHFCLLTYEQDMEVIRQFLGEEVDLARYYPEDQGFLLEFQERVMHFEIFAEA